MRPTFTRFLALSIATLLATAPALRAAEQLYTCGMHPEVIRNAPGDCPICGMELTPIRDRAAAADALQISIDPVTIQRMNLKTAPVITGPVRREVRAVGVLAFDETGRRDITTKYEGWIEKLHVAANWTPVHAGDPLFEIYSPDLYNAQLNYLVARRSERAEPGPLTQAAIARLRLFDLPQEFIDQLQQRGTVERTFTYRAPADGMVIEKMAVQGQMMRPGEVIYRLADLSTMWVQAQIYESDLPFVQPGQSAEIHVGAGAGPAAQGTVALIAPEVNAATRTAVARIVVPNPAGELRPGMFADVRLHAEREGSAVLVPDTAVLRSGETNTVFIALEDGRFEPREIQLGPRTHENYYVVRSGLAADEEVVVSGQFLLDSESQRREAIQKMLRAQSGGAPAGAPDADAHEGHDHGSAAGAGEADVELPEGVTVYTCPMDIHAHVVDDEPGKCGECGMTLVPADTVDHGNRSKAIWLEQHGAHAH